MLIEATQHPIRHTLLDGQEVTLAPGCPVELPDSQAKTLLTKAPDRVRVVGTEVTQEGALFVEATASVRPVYWLSVGQGILGPGLVTHMAKETTVRGEVRFWLCVEYGGSWRWIHESLLRSRAAYEVNLTKSKSVVVR